MDTATERLRFHDFELQPASGELYREGHPVKLQQQPARVLEALARRAGQVVSREALSQAIWGDEHFVDSEQGLNYCVRQIRIALDDPAGEPRFVETVPRRGYRFLAPVEAVTASPPSADGSAMPASRMRRASWWLSGLAAGLVVILGMRSAVHRGSPPSPAVPETAAAPAGVPPEAFEAYLQGSYLMEKPLVVERVRALPFLERAIERAPDFAPAHAAWARLMLTLHQPPLEVLPGIAAAAQRALELDPDLASGHVVQGKVRMFLHRDGAGAEAAFRRALELDPSSIEAHLAYGNLLAALGRHDEALALVRRARELDPGSALVSADLGWYYFFARRYAEAERRSRETLEIERGNTWALSCLVFTALERGDPTDALDFGRAEIAAELATEDASHRDHMPSPEIATLDDYWQARLEIFAGWRRLGFYVSPYADAIVHAARGDRDRAFEQLEQACEEGSLSAMLAVDRRFDTLRDDQRFAHVASCARLD